MSIQRIFSERTKVLRSYDSSVGAQKFVAGMQTDRVGNWKIDSLLRLRTDMFIIIISNITLFVDYPI